ncbi:SpoIIAA family protein [Methyloligella solikamskensis]|uniref:STAS/SEC14 domain-containing protein n=1 Tax=Methyloligella solikamskensis TaxID=1177756 RepID=A0ABW3JAM5_9HYPH
MLSYKEFDNAKTAEIRIAGKVSTEEFDEVAEKLEAFIERHGEVRLMEIFESFDGMEARAFWHDIRFSLRHLRDFDRCAVVCEATIFDLWSELVAPFTKCEARQFKPDQMEEAREWLSGTGDAEI